MAEKISVLIALEGGAAIERQLADISTAGQKAFADIKKAADDVGGFSNLNPDDVTAKLKEMGVTGVDQIQKIQAAVQKTAGLEKLVQGVHLAEVAFKALGLVSVTSLGGIVTAIAGLIPLMLRWAASIEEAQIEATKLGLTITQFDKLRRGLDQIGVSGKGVEEVIKTLQAASKDLPQLQLPTPGAGFGPTAASLQDVITQLRTADGAIVEFINRIQQLPPSIARDQFVLQQLGDELGGRVNQALRQGADAVDQLKASLQKPTGRVLGPEEIAAADAFQAAIRRLKASWDEFTSNPSNVGLMTSAVEALTGFLNAANETLHTTIEEFNAIAGAVNFVITTFNNAEAAVIRLGLAIRQYLGIGGGGPGTRSTLSLPPDNPLEGPPSFAGGGLIGGRGTGMSDSNLAWVSRGEHIMPAAAVAQPGVLAFLEALRGTGGNLAAVLQGMRGFALGGMVPRSIPAFAGGGLVAGMSHVTIQFPGLPSISGLRASSDVVSELQRAAALAQVRSGGRKPSRYT